ncbi:MAG TPA: DUF3800 domain-containing protein [Mucilaginibacter sp.]|jgi:hypothetical protein|nr:DUF3800 domain-containing protein [Mucilaginibacter sp.]
MEEKLLEGGENSESADLENQKKAEKERKLEAEKHELLNRVLSGNIENVKDRVAFILNTSNDARNSDRELAWQYWQTFESQLLSGASITHEQFRALTQVGSLSRIRAKIQNEYKLFQADDKVKRYRGVLEEERKQEAIDDKPSGIGTYSVYIDETGKTQDFLSVGSIWLLKYGYSTIESQRELNRWKKEKGISFEFHFTELTKHKLESYKDFFIKFLSLHPDIGFKLIVINNKGHADKNSAITDLTYHLITKGVLHEDSTRRAPLPRVLQVWLDEDEKGSDQLKLENIKERISRQKISGLYMGDFYAVSSGDNFFIQAVDLFTGAVNRKLHNPSGNNFKDEFADFILSALSFDINSIDVNNDDADQSKVFDLSDK